MRSIICFWVLAPTSVQALGHITFWVCVSIRGVARHKGRTRATFSKMFHRLSRDLSVERKEIFVSVNWTHPSASLGQIWTKYMLTQKIYAKQKALLLQDSVYLQDICLDQISTENRIKVKRNLCEASFALSFGPYFCSSPRAYNILGMRQHTECRKTQRSHRATFPKCFIDFRAIYRLSERRYSYQSTEHVLRNFSIILSVCKCNIIFFYRLYIYEIAIPTTHPPQAVPLPSQGKAIKNKKCPAFAGHRIY